jgi:hypothetical protein
MKYSAWCVSCNEFTACGWVQAEDQRGSLHPGSEEEQARLWKIRADHAPPPGGEPGAPVRATHGPEVHIGGGDLKLWEVRCELGPRRCDHAPLALCFVCGVPI